ncbi:MAG TPA: methyltransferase domain-containing protein [Actinomycetota bacterium]|nr:methyltransferase domain-containing protein [Actinomycetota bacterium]
MEGYSADTYGQIWASIYDDQWSGVFPVESTVAFLKELAGEGPALELAIGTGRIALPLKEVGVDVHGIDISEAMVAKLRTKPGGEDIPVTMGDFADVGVDETYPLIYVVFNTFFALTTQEEQIRCFANVARHLEPGGAFVIECFVPDLARFDRHQRVDARRVRVDAVGLEVSRHDPVAQQITTQIVVLTQEGNQLYPVFIRYAFPSELDLMARLAGLRLRARHGGWDDEPFTSESAAHVSVYELPE